MDFVGYQGYTWLIAIPMSVIFFFLFKTIFKRITHEKWGYIALAITLGFAMGNLSGFSAWAYFKTEANNARLSEFKEVYNLELASLEIDKFEYPDTKPTKELERFGTLTRTSALPDGGTVSLRLELVWEKDHMKLYVVDETGRWAKELPVQNA